MNIDRRTLLKTLLLAPAASLLGSRIEGFALAEAPYQSIYILLHGMFFMEFQKKKLVVMTPNYDGHQFKIRRHGESTPGDLDKEYPLYDKLAHGSTSSFPSEILQFPKSALGVSGHVLTSQKKYRCRMVLPLPEAIFAYRTDSKSNFHPTGSSSIGALATNLTGPRIATITCLAYDAGSQGGYTVSYYAEHIKKPTADDANGAYLAAKDICGAKFDFAIENCPVPDACLDDPNSLPVGTDQGDEFALRELAVPPSTCPAKQDDTTGKLNVDVGSCPQFGINP